MAGSKTTIHERLKETAQGTQISTGGDLVIGAQKLISGLLAGGDSDLDLIGSTLNVGGEASLQADGDVNLIAQQYRDYAYNRTIKKGFGG
ncbi:hemagglutinin repeat-containing protein [Vibrio sp. PP-XX7]